MIYNSHYKFEGGNNMLNNILYSDAILHDDEIKKVIGEHKTRSIPNVEEEQLKTILEIIFYSNPGIVFKTIQYSRKFKELIFYTDKDLSLNEYLEYYKSLPKPFQYRKLTSKEDVLNEIEDILNSDINTDSNCISLYDVLLLIRKTNYNIDQLKEGYEQQLNYNFHYTERYIKIGVDEFDFVKDELKITFGFDSKYGSNLIFSKEDNDLFIKETNYNTMAHKIFSNLRDILLELYNKFENYRPFYEEKKCNLRPVNSNFFIDIGRHGIKIKDNNNNFFGEHFTITAYPFTNDYNNQINSHNILNVIAGHEDEIFKRIFVKISDCPKWSQPILYEIRQNQLAKEQKIEDKKKYQEMRKEKILALTRKIFPFLKK